MKKRPGLAHLKKILVKIKITIHAKKSIFVVKIVLFV